MSRLFPHMTCRPRDLIARAALGALATAALLAPTIGSAAQPYETTVYYNLLDLSTDQGTRSVYERIVNAAETVCPPGDSVNLSEIDANKECERQAIARAVAQIGNARLAALHARAIARHG